MLESAWRPLEALASGQLMRRLLELTSPEWPRRRDAGFSSASYLAAGCPRSRPRRPTIDIPSSASSISTPSPRSSARTPRKRYPQSALAAIPEHRSLDHFPPTSPSLPHTGTSTLPLSLRGRQGQSRPRSQSDSAVRGQGGRRERAEGGFAEVGTRAKYSSFIDVSDNLLVPFPRTSSYRYSHR